MLKRNVLLFLFTLVTLLIALFFAVSLRAMFNANFQVEVVKQHIDELFLRFGIGTLEVQYLELGEHPRIFPLSPHMSLSSAVSRDVLGYDINQFVCDKPDVYRLSACYRQTRDEGLIASIYERLADQSFISCTAAGNKSNGWQLAMVYDQVADYRNRFPVLAQKIENKIIDTLSSCIHVLDGNSASLWHGRFSIGAEVWIMSLVLPDTAHINNLRARAIRHFFRSIEAITLTEGWPEGYNYWINSRALQFFVGIQGLLLNTSDIELKKRLTRLVERVGLWHIYMTRPDHRIAPIADDGPRVDLKDETRKVIDLIAKITQNPIFATYARYVQNLHGAGSYYSSYRWLIPYVYDPDVESIADPGKSLSIFNSWLPTWDVFGQGAYNQVVIRSGWGVHDTFIQLRASDTFTHHQHYDAGHFTVFKHMPILADSSVYFGVQTENRLYYSMRSIAKNTVLVERKGDRVQPNHLFGVSINDGGQRLSMPTGSAIESVSDWKNNRYRGLHLEGGRLNDISYDPHLKILSLTLELTQAYDNSRFDTQNRNGKVNRMTRVLQYDYNKDSIYIKDSIHPADTVSKINQLFHVMHEPELDHTAQTLSVLNSKGQKVATVFSKTKLEDINKVGGDGKQYWVQDIDTGISFNAEGGAKQVAWFDNPKWRAELSPALNGDEEVVIETIVKIESID